LPEILVTVAVVAVLASAVIPSVISQIGKGDMSALRSDLITIRSAIETFTTDVRHYPSQMAHLNTAITSTDLQLLSSGTTAAYGGDAVFWKGPYLQSKQSLTTGTATADQFQTAGLSLLVKNTLVVESKHIAVDLAEVDGATVAVSKIAALEQAIDGNSSYGTSCVANTSGLVRVPGGCATVRVLLVPIGGN
jgi:type II secretory pathway pseudopilin PulG